MLGLKENAMPCISDSVEDRRFGEFIEMAQDMQVIIRGMVDPICAERGINRLSLVILNQLAFSPNQTPSHLSSMLGAQRTNLATQCRKLEELGLVKREQNNFDHRSYSLVVTDKGKELLKEIQAAVTRIESEVVRILPADVRQNLNRNWRAMREAISCLARSVTGASVTGAQKEVQG